MPPMANMPPGWRGSSHRSLSLLTKFRRPSCTRRLYWGAICWLWSRPFLSPVFHQGMRMCQPLSVNMPRFTMRQMFDQGPEYRFSSREQQLQLTKPLWVKPEWTVKQERTDTWAIPPFWWLDDGPGYFNNQPFSGLLIDSIRDNFFLINTFNKWYVD